MCGNLITVRRNLITVRRNLCAAQKYFQVPRTCFVVRGNYHVPCADLLASYHFRNAILPWLDNWSIVGSFGNPRRSFKWVILSENGTHCDHNEHYIGKNECSIVRTLVWLKECVVGSPGCPWLCSALRNPRIRLIIKINRREKGILDCFDIWRGGSLGYWVQCFIS